MLDLARDLEAFEKTQKDPIPNATRLKVVVDLGKSQEGVMSLEWRFEFIKAFLLANGLDTDPTLCRVTIVDKHRRRLTSDETTIITEIPGDCDVSDGEVSVLGMPVEVTVEVLSKDTLSPDAINDKITKLAVTTFSEDTKCSGGILTRCGRNANTAFYMLRKNSDTDVPDKDIIENYNGVYFYCSQACLDASAMEFSRCQRCKRRRPSKNEEGEDNLVKDTLSFCELCWPCIKDDTDVSQFLDPSKPSYEEVTEKVIKNNSTGYCHNPSCFCERDLSFAVTKKCLSPKEGIPELTKDNSYYFCGKRCRESWGDEHGRCTKCYHKCGKVQMTDHEWVCQSCSDKRRW